MPSGVGKSFFLLSVIHPGCLGNLLVTALNNFGTGVSLRVNRRNIMLFPCQDSKTFFDGLSLVESYVLKEYTLRGIRFPKGRLKELCF